MVELLSEMTQKIEKQAKTIKKLKYWNQKLIQLVEEGGNVMRMYHSAFENKI